MTMCVTNQANCITVWSHFPTMSVTYQVNYLVKFSGNVCDISVQPYHPIFGQCVWQIRQTVSLYDPIFRQCPWHIRSITLSNILIMCVTYQDNCITVSSNFLTMSVTYQANYLVKFYDNVCDISWQLNQCIIPFSDNVCDKLGKLPCQIFWQFLWEIRSTVVPRALAHHQKKRAWWCRSHSFNTRFIIATRWIQNDL